MIERTVAVLLARSGFGAFRCARPKSDPQVREAFESFAAKVQADLPDAVRGKKIEVWRRHKARVGRQGAARYRMRMDPHLWRRLSRTRRDRRAGHAIRKHRSHDLAEISKTVAEGAHAILTPDGAGRHGARALRVPDNITLLPLPPHAPQINPVENVRACLRANKLATVRSITTRDHTNRINI